MSTLEEYKAIKEACGLINYTDHGKVEVKGEDRIGLLNNILTNDIKALKVGQSCPSALLEHTGKILMYMYVAMFCDRVAIIVEPGDAEKTIKLIEKYIIMEDVKVEDATKKYVTYGLHGPKAKEVIGKFDVENIMTCQGSMIGIEGYFINTYPEHEEKLKEIAKNASIQEVSRETAEIIRIESGIPRYNIDMDDTITLPETGMDKIAASETKGCYPGQEVVARTNTYKGWQKMMKRVEYKPEELPKPGDKMIKEGKEIGWIASTTLTPNNQAYALAYFKKGNF